MRDVIDSNGVVKNHIGYNAFGERSVAVETVDFLFGYTGRDWDADVEFQYTRARWYDPTVGRFISNDPIGFNAGDANLYRYVGNKTTSFTDPSGLEEEGADRVYEEWYYDSWGWGRWWGPRHIISYTTGYYDAKDAREEWNARFQARDKLEGGPNTTATLRDSERRIRTALEL